MPPSGYIPGVGSRAVLLERFAKPALNPPGDFVGNFIFPQARVDTFYGLAPISGNEFLEVDDDDRAGLKNDFPEVLFGESEYEWEIGFRGRKAIIGRLQQIKAAHAAAMSKGLGGSSNEQFNLESRVTNLITAQHVRRNELLKIRQLLKVTPVVGSMSGNYPTANVLSSIEINTATTTQLLDTLSTAVNRAKAAGKGQPNAIVFGDGAWTGALSNPNYKDMLPDTAYKILTAEAFAPVLRMPDGSMPLLRVATATYKTAKKAAPVPMMDLHIWVGHVNTTPDGSGTGFGYNFWHPHPDSGGEIFVYRMTVGSARTVHISVEGFDRPLVNDGSQGVLIPVTIGA